MEDLICGDHRQGPGLRARPGSDEGCVASMRTYLVLILLQSVQKQGSLNHADDRGGRHTGDASRSYPRNYPGAFINGMPE